MKQPKKTAPEATNKTQASFLRKLDVLAEDMAKAANATRTHKPKRIGGE